MFFCLIFRLQDLYLFFVEELSFFVWVDNSNAQMTLGDQKLFTKICVYLCCNGRAATARLSNPWIIKILFRDLLRKSS